MFALLRPAMQCTESTGLPKYWTKTWYAQHGAVAKIKRATSFLNKRSGTQFYHDWKSIKSISDILHKNFQEDHTNSRRFPGVVNTLPKLGLTPTVKTCTANYDQTVVCFLQWRLVPTDSGNIPLPYPTVPLLTPSPKTGQSKNAEHRLHCIGMWRSQPISHICIRRMRISCAKSVGFGCGYGFVARSKLPAIMATVIQLIYLKLSSVKRTSSEQLK